MPFREQLPSSDMSFRLNPLTLSLLLATSGFSGTPPSSPTSWLIRDVGPSYIAKAPDLARWAMVSLSRMPASGMASTVTWIPVALVNGARWDDW